MSKTSESASEVDAEETVELLLRDLRSSRDGLTSREAGRRLVQYGPNELSRRGGPRWPAELARQLTHPLALLARRHPPAGTQTTSPATSHACI